MQKFYPDTKRLFADCRGRKLKYTPAQLIEEFEAYIKDLQDNPIEIETEYKQLTTKADKQGKSIQVRKEKRYRPPKVYDFVCRWLGMSDSWWRLLPRKKNSREFLTVKKKIEQYCYDCKYDGAVIGLYNVNIIARDLGLTDKIEHEVNKTEQISFADIDLSAINDEERQVLLKLGESVINKKE